MFTAQERETVQYHAAVLHMVAGPCVKRAVAFELCTPVRSAALMNSASRLDATIQGFGAVFLYQSKRTVARLAVVCSFHPRQFATVASTNGAGTGTPTRAHLA